MAAIPASRRATCSRICELEREIDELMRDPDLSRPRPPGSTPRSTPRPARATLLPSTRGFQRSGDFEPQFGSPTFQAFETVIFYTTQKACGFVISCKARIPQNRVLMRASFSFFTPFAHASLHYGTIRARGREPTVLHVETRRAAILQFGRLAGSLAAFTSVRRLVFLAVWGKWRGRERLF